MTGRPSKYSSEIAANICEQLVTGLSLRKICMQPDMPTHDAVFRWLSKHRDFAEDYARSREGWADAVFDELFDIADDGKNDWMAVHGKENEGWKFNGEHAQRTRIRIDTRKWALARMSPRKYGDKITQEHTGPDGAPMFTDEERYRRIAALKERIENRIAQNNTEPTDAYDLA